MTPPLPHPTPPHPQPPPDFSHVNIHAFKQMPTEDYSNWATTSLPCTSRLLGKDNKWTWWCLRWCFRRPEWLLLIVFVTWRDSSSPNSFIFGLLSTAIGWWWWRNRYFLGSGDWAFSLSPTPSDIIYRTNHSNHLVVNAVLRWRTIE